MNWDSLPEGMGRYSDLAFWITALVVARRRLERGEGSIEEARAMEEKVDEAAWKLLSETTKAPLNLSPELVASEEAAARALVEHLKRDGTL